MIKLTERQRRTIRRRVATAYRKIEDAYGYLGSVTALLREYGLDTVEAVYHPGDGIVFQEEGDDMTDYNSLDDYLRHLDEDCP